MRTYRQYCPIARASELLHERWTMIILRNIVLVGCRSFNEIAEGAPGLSRGLLSTRLKALEHAGVIEIRRRSDGRGSTYEPTEARRELSDVMLALQRWGTKWVELKPEQAHPRVVLWAWATLYLVRERLPRRRVLPVLRQSASQSVAPLREDVDQMSLLFSTSRITATCRPSGDSSGLVRRLEPGSPATRRSSDQ